MTLASGVAGGATLVCTEGLSPPLSHVATPSTVSMSSSTTMITSTHERYILSVWIISVCVCVCVFMQYCIYQHWAVSLDPCQLLYPPLKLLYF